MPRITALLFVLALTLATAGAQGAKAPRDVVREYARSSNDGNLDALLALFDREAAVFVRPDSLDRLAGPISDVMGTHAQRLAFCREAFARRPLPRTEVVHTLPVGDLTAVVTRTSNPPAFNAATYSLSIYRIRDGQIRDLWNVATSSAESPNHKPAEDAIRSFIVANNAGDTEAFLRHFSRDAKLFRASDDPRGLADKYSARMSTAEGRRSAITAAFANGSPGQVEIVGILSFGDLVVSHDRITLPTGRVMNQMKVYRVRNGQITHDWTAFEQ